MKLPGLPGVGPFTLAEGDEPYPAPTGVDYFVVPSGAAPPPPLPPHLPPLPPASPTSAAVADSKFGCGYDGPHVTFVDSTEALVAAVDDVLITCIKLAPTTFVLNSTLHIERALAIAAEEGRATLDGAGTTQLFSLWGTSHGSGADVSLFNLTLRNGYATVRSRTDT